MDGEVVMKNLLCKWFNLVHKKELEVSEQKVVERDKFIIQLSKDLDPTRCKVLYTGESANNILFDGTVYVLGNYVSVVGCKVDTIVFAPGCEKCYVAGVTIIKNSIKLSSSDWSIGGVSRSGTEWR